MNILKAAAVLALVMVALGLFVPTVGLLNGTAAGVVLLALGVVLE